MFSAFFFISNECKIWLLKQHLVDLPFVVNNNMCDLNVLEKSTNKILRKSLEVYLKYNTCSKLYMYSIWFKHPLKVSDEKGWWKKHDMLLTFLPFSL